MADIPVRDLRNDVSAVLRRVEAGEHLRVTVSGRPVAEISPLPGRPRSITWEDFRHGLKDSRADASLASELRELIPDMSHDLDGE